MDYRTLVIILCLAGSAALANAQQPYWWSNPHQDDPEDLYERGSAEGVATEPGALVEAVESAKTLLLARIGVVPALTRAGIEASAREAIVDVQIVANQTEKSASGWKAWVLVQYPQARKKELLDRWNASLSVLQDLRSHEPPVPVQFSVGMTTSDFRRQYKAGESVTLNVQAEKDCFLLVVDEQSDGTTVLLFPNRFHPADRVPRGTVVSIPGPGSRFRLLVQPPFGEDRIVALAATKESALHAHFSRLVDELPEGQDWATSPRGLVVQGVTEALDASQADVQWSRAELVLSTFPQD